jgi:lipopolysaccharide export system protein LptA
MTKAFVLALVLALSTQGALAQGAQVAFGGLKQDTSLPVEISADSLSVNQTDGTAVFSGNVIVGQGEMRLSAGEIRVAYGDDGKTIETLFATGGVTIANATDAAEAREAVYEVATGAVVMTGDVLLTQGQNAITGQKLRLDLKSGTGVMEGRVTTTFVPGQEGSP